MSIARYARKERLKHGAQKDIARKLEAKHGGEWEAAISRVMNDDTKNISTDRVRTIRAAIARRLRMSVSEAFPLDGIAA